VPTFCFPDDKINRLRRLFARIVEDGLASLVDISGPPSVSIEFSPGSAHLDKRGENSLNSLAELLSQHPDLSITLCAPNSDRDRDAVYSTLNIRSRREPDARGLFGEPSASVLDQAKAEPALAKLAAERTRVVRRYLTEEKDVDAARLSECGSTFPAADQGTPRVDVSF
jgi:outer membrane protein OmpA-like peptidoglycan-associated protein